MLFRSPGLTEYVVAPLFGTCALLLMFASPLLAMRFIAEERRNGTLVLLSSAPLSATEIVLGKFVGFVGFLLLVIGLTTLMALALFTGALFSVYVFMPKRRLLPYSSDPAQRGDELLFNLAIAPFAIVVNFVTSLPLAFAAWRSGTLNRRVPATLLIALGAFVPSLTDTLTRAGSTEAYQLGKAVGALVLLIGFLTSVDDPDEITLPLLGAPLRAALRRARGERTR